MTKRMYVRPSVEIDTTDMEAQLLAASLTSVQSSGLDNDESLDYGEGEDKEKNLWDDAW